MKKWILGGLAAIAVAGGVTYANLDDDQRALLANIPTDRNVLFWSTEQRDAAFRMLDAMPVLAKSRVIEAGGTVRALPQGTLDLSAIDIDAYMNSQRSAAIVILHDGKLVYEKYGLGFGPEGKWTSFSVAKSLTSTMVGAAVKDGHIKSLDDKVTDYIAGL